MARHTESAKSGIARRLIDRPAASFLLPRREETAGQRDSSTRRDGLRAWGLWVCVMPLVVLLLGATGDAAAAVSVVSPAGGPFGGPPPVVADGPALAQETDPDGMANQAEQAEHAEQAEQAEQAPHDETGSAGEHGAAGSEAHAHVSRLSDEALPLQLDGFPARPKPILELGPHFLGTGTLGKGFRLPTGAVWQPAFLAFGALRTAVQTFDRGEERTTEAVARLDLFGNLRLSGSERVVLGFRNFDQNGRFTSYVFESGPSGPAEGFNDETNAEIASLFFEGDFGEIFPNLSRRDFATTDWGFSVGRQPLYFQEGLLINDSVDGVGITRNTLLPRGTSNFRLTTFVGWNNLDRTDRGQGRVNREDDSAVLLAVLTSTDVRATTLDADAAWLFSDAGDLANLGLTGVQRLGRLNSSLHLVASYAPDGESALSTDGVLLLSELSWTPRRTHNLAYVNLFWAVDDFSSISRDPSVGGPLGRAGINFASVGLGSFGAPLSSQARDVAGGSVGYQMFFHNTRRQLIAELGLRAGTVNEVDDQAAFTVRYQIAMGRRFVVVADGFVGLRDPAVGERTTLSGARLELVTKF